MADFSDFKVMLKIMQEKVILADILFKICFDDFTGPDLLGKIF